MKPKVEGLLYLKEEQIFKIRELEVSITPKCHLRCDNCGFYIPHQPNPAFSDDVVSDIVNGLKKLKELNIKIGSLGILGGEPTFNPKLLTRVLQSVSKFKNIERIEVVTHGLTPQNIEKKALSFIDKLSISIYFEKEELLDLWREYLDFFASHIELSLRKDKEWDRWLGEEVVDDTKAQEMFDYCWYRKHCVSIERNRLFLCSRIAKLSKDKEGLVLDEQVDVEAIINYLNQSTFLPSCKTCTPMMGLTTIPAGQQPDDRVLKLIPKAISFLSSQLHEKS